MGMKEQLSEFDLCVEQNVNSEEPIDFVLRDKDTDEEYATVWGVDPSDVQVECTHPDQCVEYDDDEPVGQCALCGASCSAHYVVDAGNVEDYSWSGRRLVPTEWEMPDEPGGIIGDYLKELGQ